MSVVSEMARVAPAPAVRALLREVMDYAGLFPPSEVPLRDAVANYAAYRAEPDGWMLGNFVAPAARLGELAETPPYIKPPQPEPLAHARGYDGTVNRGPGTVNSAWQVSAVLGAEPLKDLEAVAAFNARAGGGPRVTAAEARVGSAADAARLAAAVPADLELWVEFTGGPAEIPPELAAPKRGAKIRTGGVAAASFPSAPDVARFMQQCRRAGVRFKATAGLHHAITGEYPLTYAPGSARARMFGFLNVLLAAACVRADRSMSQELAEKAEVPTIVELAAILECTDPGAFVLDADGMTARPTSADNTESRSGPPRRFSPEELRRARELMASFGSCSFVEPVAALREMGWL